MEIGMGPLTPRSLSCVTDSASSTSGLNATRIQELDDGSERPLQKRRSNARHSLGEPCHEDEEIHSPQHWGGNFACDPSKTRTAVVTVPRRTQHVSCRPVQQMQILSSFLELHFPSKAAKADLASRRSWLLGLPEIDLAISPLLRNAVDTVCFAHLGAQNHDTRLQHQAQQSYGRVLFGLVQAMERQRPRYDPRHVMASMMLLCLYDDALPQPHSTVSGWAAHYLGAQEFLKACGPSSLDPSVSFDRLIFMNMRVPSIFLGIARRKGVMLSQPDWIAFGAGHKQANHALAQLYKNALQVPGVMEEAESLIGRRDDDRNLQYQWSRIQQLQREMYHWITHESTMATYWGKHLSDCVYVTDADKFDASIEEHCVLESNTTFLSHYNFPDYNMVQDFTLYLVFMMALNCTLLRLLHFHPTADTRYLQRTRDNVRQDAFAIASDMCKTVHYQSKFESQGIAGFIELLVSLAQAFFEEVGAFEKLGWCQAVRCATQLRIKRLRLTQPKTLCRVGDLADDFATVGRFKMRNPHMANERHVLVERTVQVRRHP
ncbi:hypothetical protein D0864_08897 [Hortaea werneckii]|uniref:Transcription factor domain-containing protein n=1 Tax=Hortaea werneckii TaxID=91943 RepID=A0A3M7ET37_HORWE|nr:hypothetical protein D0864_08897 [Hortaea werneckii]